MAEQKTTELRSAHAREVIDACVAKYPPERKQSAVLSAPLRGESLARPPSLAGLLLPELLVPRDRDLALHAPRLAVAGARLPRLVEAAVGLEVLIEASHPALVGVLEVEEETVVPAVHVHADVLGLEGRDAELIDEQPGEVLPDHRLVGPHTLQVDLANTAKVAPAVELELEVALLDPARGVAAPADPDLRPQLAAVREGPGQEHVAVEDPVHVLRTGRVGAGHDDVVDGEVGVRRLVVDVVPPDFGGVAGEGDGRDGRAARFGLGQDAVVDLRPVRVRWHARSPHTVVGEAVLVLAIVEHGGDDHVAELDVGAEPLETHARDGIVRHRRADARREPDFVERAGLARVAAAVADDGRGGVGRARVRPTGRHVEGEEVHLDAADHLGVDVAAAAHVAKRQRQAIRRRVVELAAAEGEGGVEDPNAHGHDGLDPRSGDRVGRVVVDGDLGFVVEGSQPVDRLAETVEAVNLRQKRRLFEKISTWFDGRLKGKTIALWGLAFKPRTDDMREASSRALMEALWEAGATVRAYDPEAMDEARRLYPDQDGLELCDSAMETVEGADALAIVTEWQEFRSPDFQTIKDKLAQPVIFDGRNLYDPAFLSAQGFSYFAIGRSGRPAPELARRASDRA